MNEQERFVETGPLPFIKGQDGKKREEVDLNKEFIDDGCNSEN